MEKLLKKLRKLLGKAGLEEEKIESILEDVKSEDGEPESEPVGEKESEEPTPAEPSESTETPASEPESEPSPEPVEHDGEDGVGEEVEPSEPVEPVVEDQVDETVEEELPPVEPTPEVEPVVESPEPDYKAMFEESQKVVDALTRRVDSMEDALRKARILEEEYEEVGLENGTGAPANDAEGDVMSSVLNKINRGY